ncbi:unnamed protein product, partial [Pelagomonas calceolata]
SSAASARASASASAAEAARRRYICLPRHLSPANFLEMRMAEQRRRRERKARSVAPFSRSVSTCAQSNRVRVGCTDDSSLSPFSARTRLCWLARPVIDHNATPSSSRRVDGVEVMI